MKKRLDKDILIPIGFVAIILTMIIFFNFSQNLSIGHVISELTEKEIYAKGIVINSCKGFQGPGGPVMQGCEAVYDKNIQTGFAMGRQARVYAEFYFNKNDISRVYIYPSSYFLNAQLIFSDGSNMPIGTLVAYKWHEFVINKKDLEWVGVAWSAQQRKVNHNTGLIEIAIESGQVSTNCIDSDGGNNIYLAGKTSKGTEYKLDTCTLPYSKKLGFPPGDYTDKSKSSACWPSQDNVCYVTEYTCSNDKILGTYSLCPNECKDGACAKPSEIQGYVSVATLMDSYKTGEIVKLTDPPTGEAVKKVSSTAKKVDEQKSLIDIKSSSNQQPLANAPLSFESELKLSAYSLQIGELKNQNILTYTSPESAKYKGYIVQFKEEPLIKQYIKYKPQLEKEQQIALKTNDFSKYNKLKVTVNNKIKAQKLTVLGEHKKAIASIQKIAPSAVAITGDVVENVENNFFKNLISKITGLVSKNPESKKSSENKILGEYITTFNGVALDISAGEAKEIKKLKNVKAVYLNYEVKAVLMDSIPQINADDVWQLKDSLGREITGKDVTIGIIDTGIDYKHPDLGGCFGSSCKVVSGYDFINNDDDPMDDHGHGTHVAATAVGNGVLKGVAPDAKLYAYKVLNAQGRGYSDGIIAAIERAIDPNQDGDFSDHLDVISLSLGGAGNPDDPMSQAIDNTVNSGVVAVVAAGNSGPGENTIGSPGTARKAITVGAIDKNNKIASFSSRGPVILGDKFLIKPDIVAPGVGICAAQWDSAWNDKKCFDDKHIAISGTSMATPHVAGIAALLLQKNPDWTPNEIKHTLRNTAVNLNLDVITQGYGKVDALNAVNQQTPPPIAILHTGGKVKGIIEIEGEIITNNFKNYVLYYGVGKNPVSWVEIISSYEKPSSNTLVKLDTNLLNDDYYIIKLVVTDNNNIKSEDKNLLEIDNIGITNPLSGDLYRAGDTLEIKGVVPSSNLKDYQIKYSKIGRIDNWLSDGITLTRSGDTIANWDTSLRKAGKYKLKLIINYEDGRIKEELLRDIYLDPTLKKSWPKEIRWDLGLPGPNENFPLSIGNLEPIVEDLNNDGIKEIIILKCGNQPELYVFTPDGNLFSGWPINVGASDPIFGTCISTPVVDDINNDGFKEIIVYDEFRPGRPEARLYALKYDGSLLWSSNAFPKGYGSQIIIADLDMDNKKEIIMKTQYYQYRQMIIFDNIGQILKWWSLPTGVWSSLPEPIPAVGNFDNDPDLEIVYVGNFFDSSINKVNGIITIYNKDGSTVNGWPIYIFSYTTSSPAVGDINDDGKDEIVIGLSTFLLSETYEGGVYAYDRYGKVLPGWPFNKNEIFWASPSLADLDVDGKLEIAIIGSYSLKAYVLKYDGSLFPGWPQECYRLYHFSTSIGDINGDSIPDIVNPCQVYYGDGTWDTGIFAWDKNGNLIEGFPKPMPEASWSVISDIDNDGNVELIASFKGPTLNMGRDYTKTIQKGIIAVYELNKKYNENAMPWPTFHHDVQHTGLYKSSKSEIPNEILKSKIQNEGNANIEGYLLMKVEKFVPERYGPGRWEKVKVIVDEKTSRIIKPNEYLALDTIWESVGSYRPTEIGKYRVYASLRDSTGKILTTKDGKKLENIYEFEVKQGKFLISKPRDIATTVPVSENQFS